MKLNRLLFSLTLVALLISCNASKKSVAPPGFVSWDKKMIELGPVKKGEKRSMAYEFTNTSEEDIQIDIVDACECTKVDFPRGVFKKGEKGQLKVVFDSSEKENAETIGINVIFKNTHPNGVPRIEVVEYSFEITQ